MISTATMNSWLKISGDDAILELIEPGVILFLEDYTGRLFTSPAAAITEILDGGDPYRGSLLGSDVATGPEWFLLQEEPNGAAVTTVSYRDSQTSDWVDQTLTDFELDDRQLYVKQGTPPRGKRNVRIIYPFGFATDDGPADATLVALQLIKFKYENRDSGLIRSAAIGPMRITYADALSADVIPILDAMRRPVLPF